MLCSERHTRFTEQLDSRRVATKARSQLKGTWPSRCVCEHLTCAQVVTVHGVVISSVGVRTFN